mmetsp:Transcript_27936/g.76247  ORF Transcript_27936/g.76247 Transcript_27936/m.76247 type:complete len:105 (+) Transcript_27936:1924-2238(+)
MLFTLLPLKFILTINAYVSEARRLLRSHNFFYGIDVCELARRLLRYQRILFIFCVVELEHIEHSFIQLGPYNWHTCSILGCHGHTDFSRDDNWVLSMQLMWHDT